MLWGSLKTFLKFYLISLSALLMDALEKIHWKHFKILKYSQHSAYLEFFYPKYGKYKSNKRSNTDVLQRAFKNVSFEFCCTHNLCTEHVQSYNYCNQPAKVFPSGFTSAGVAAGSIAAATQAGIGDFHFSLFLCPSLKKTDCSEI